MSESFRAHLVAASVGFFAMTIATGTIVFVSFQGLCECQQIISIINIVVVYLLLTVNIFNKFS